MCSPNLTKEVFLYGFRLEIMDTYFGINFHFRNVCINSMSTEHKFDPGLRLLTVGNNLFHPLTSLCPYTVYVSLLVHFWLRLWLRYVGFGFLRFPTVVGDLWSSLGTSFNRESLRPPLVGMDTNIIVQPIFVLVIGSFSINKKTIQDKELTIH